MRTRDYKEGPVFAGIVVWDMSHLDHNTAFLLPIVDVLDDRAIAVPAFRNSVPSSMAPRGTVSGNWNDKYYVDDTH